MLKVFHFLLILSGTAFPALAGIHEELMKFVGEEGLLHDYVGERPTPADCAACRPNAMGWWSPIENGPMFTGPWLEACVRLAKRSGRTEDRTLCRKLAAGLMLASGVSDVPGMIVRGVATDGRAHYPLGSEDQTLPWFFGLSAYLESGLATAAEAELQRARLRSVAEALEAVGWKCPCDQGFKGEFRGDFIHGLPFRNAAHYLFILRAVCEATGDETWRARYEKACGETQDGTSLTRLEVCAAGYAADLARLPKLEPGLLWIYVCAQGCLMRLAEWDKPHATFFRRGLAANAERARRFIALSRDYDNSTERPFRYANWRAGYAWRPQKSQKDAEEVAASGNPDVLGHRKDYERKTMTAPLSAAAICAYAGRYPEDCREAIARYDYSTLCVSEFFLADIVRSRQHERNKEGQ